MKCKEFTTLIDGYMTGELSTEKQETFEEHFFECDRCYAELKLNDTLQSKEFRVALKGKMPIFIKKPLLVLTTILIFVVSSILIINRINYSKMLLIVCISGTI